MATYLRGLLALLFLCAPPMVSATLQIHREPWLGQQNGGFLVEAPSFVNSPDIRLVGARSYESYQKMVGIQLDYSNGYTYAAGVTSELSTVRSTMLDDRQLQYLKKLQMYKAAFSPTDQRQFISRIAIQPSNSNMWIIAGSTDGYTDVASSIRDGFDDLNGYELIGFDAILDTRDDFSGVVCGLRSVWRPRPTTFQQLRYTSEHGSYKGEAFLPPDFITDYHLHVVSAAWWGNQHYVKGLQFTYSNGAVITHGKVDDLSDSSRELVLAPGEYFSRTGGRANGGLADHGVAFWWLQTNTGRLFSMGTGLGTPYIDDAPVKDTTIHHRRCWGPHAGTTNAETADQCSASCRVASNCMCWSMDGGVCIMKDSNITREKPGVISGMVGSEEKWEIVGFAGAALDQPNAENGITRLSFLWRPARPLAAVESVQLSAQFGWNGGVPFETPRRYTADHTLMVKELRVWDWYQSVSGYQFVYNDDTVDDEEWFIAGHSGVSDRYQFALRPEQGEYISGMKVWAEEYSGSSKITRIQITTNHGRQWHHGDIKTSDAMVHSFPPPSFQPGVAWMIVGTRGTFSQESHRSVRKLTPIWRRVVKATPTSVVYRNMQLDFDNSVVMNTYDSVLMEVELDNDSNTKQTGRLDKQYSASRTTTYEDSYTRSVAYEVGTKVSTTIAGGTTFAKQSFTVEFWGSHQWTSTSTHSKSVAVSSTESVNFIFYLEATAHTKAVGKARGQWTELSVPYTADVETVLSDGTTDVISVSGVMTSAALTTFIEYSNID